MNYKLILDIAKSLLLARWKQTLVAAIGVTFSIAMFIALLGFMTGLNDLLDGLFNEIKPNPNQPINASDAYKTHHNFIESVKAVGGRLEIYNNAAIIKTLNADPRVLGLAPKITAQVLYNSGATDITGIVSGIDVDAETKLFFF